MPVEGISMTTVFSLVTVGMALSMSAFIGGYFLQPAFDIETVMGSVAYDIATMFDIAYTMPGEVTIMYYGPGSCMWNYNQEANSSESFHCFSGEAVIIDDVYIDNELVYLYNDTYVRYDDVNNPLAPGLKIATSFYYPRPSFGTVSIPYYNAQLCAFSEGGFSYCGFAYAPFAGSYTDVDFLTANTPYSATVEDYSFVVSKSNVGDYYYTIDNDASNPDNLIKFLRVVSSVYTKICNTNYNVVAQDTNVYAYYEASDISIPEQQLIDSDYLDTGDVYTFVELLKGNRWHVYDNHIICQESLVLSDEAPYSISVIEENDMSLNSYITQYCFDINSISERNPCSNVNNIIFDSNFINTINSGTTYYASQTSCIKPYITFSQDDNLVIKAVPAVFNYFNKVCENA